MAAKKNDKVLTADPEFCLGDANIALITSDGWVFCVHKGVLGRISVVFRNMFEDCRLPKPEPEQQAKFNNLDMIHISEPRVILKLFLAIVYDQKSVASIKCYGMLGQLMVFCDKYMICSIFKRIVAFLKPNFPDNLADFSKLIRDGDGPTSGLQTTNMIYIMRVALDTNLKILPVVGLYLLAVNQERTMSHLYQFSHQLLVQYSHGLSKLSGPKYKSELQANLNNNLLSFDTSNRCLHPRTCRDLWQSFKTTYLTGVTISTLIVLLRYAEDISQASLCQFCGDELKPKFRALGEELWMSLPEVFGIANNWEVLKKEEEERLKTAED